MQVMSNIKNWFNEEKLPDFCFHLIVKRYATIPLRTIAVDDVSRIRAYLIVNRQREQNACDVTTMRSDPK